MEAQTIFTELEDMNIHLVVLKINDNDISVMEKAIRELSELPEESLLLHEVAYMLNKIVENLTFKGLRMVEECVTVKEPEEKREDDRIKEEHDYRMRQIESWKSMPDWELSR